MLPNIILTFIAFLLRSCACAADTVWPEIVATSWDMFTPDRRRAWRGRNRTMNTSRNALWSIKDKERSRVKIARREHVLRTESMPLQSLFQPFWKGIPLRICIKITIDTFILFHCGLVVSDQTPAALGHFWQRQLLESRNCNAIPEYSPPSSVKPMNCMIHR